MLFKVNIPGEKLTDVCAAAHTLGVVGLEHLPVPAASQRPPLLSKEHLAIADESELRGVGGCATASSSTSSQNIYTPFTTEHAVGAHNINNSLGMVQSSMMQSHSQAITKLTMHDINSINVNPFFMMQGQVHEQENDDIILLQHGDDPGGGGGPSRLHHHDPDIIPIAFGDGGSGMQPGTGGGHHQEPGGNQHQRIFSSHNQIQQQTDKVNLVSKRIQSK